MGYNYDGYKNQNKVIMQSKIGKVITQWKMQPNSFYISLSEQRCSVSCTTDKYQQVQAQTINDNQNHFTLRAFNYAWLANVLKVKEKE